MIWGLSLHGWEDVMRFSLAIVGVFGLLVGLSTFFVVTLQREEIANSRTEVEQLKKDTAEANRVAEGEKLARLKLENEMAWRFLSEEQQTELTNAAKPFAGTVFDLITYQDDPEALRFAGLIGKMLIDAGWQFEKSNSFLWIPLVVGVHIDVAPSNEKQLASAVNAVSAVLAKSGVAWNASANAELEGVADKAHVIRVKVGKKPERVR